MKLTPARRIFATLAIIALIFSLANKFSHYGKEKCTKKNSYEICKDTDGSVSITNNGNVSSIIDTNGDGEADKFGEFIGKGMLYDTRPATKEEKFIFKNITE